MKKLTLIYIVFLTMFGCGDEVKFNTPAFQGDRENELWRAESFSARILDNGYLSITGTNNIERVNLTVPSVAESRFVVGNNIEAIVAEYIDGFGTTFSTNNTPDESVSLYPELGEIIIEEIDLVNGTFTGTYRFLAFDVSGLNSVGFTNGIFFKVPLVSGQFPTNPVTCVDVEINAETALMAYEATFSSSLDFVEVVAFETACNAYSQALNEQRIYCGDDNGALLEVIENLENCTLTCELATRNRSEAQTQYNAATIGNFNDKCSQFVFYLQEQIDICGDEDGSLQLVIDDLDCNDSDGDGVPNVFENFNGDADGNLDDLGDDSDGDGVFNYLDNDDDGDGILTQFEAFDGDGNPVDTNLDGDVNYLDNDDDGDGILTINENADPNGDGNPDDALDSDGNGVPDYLQPA